MTLIIEIFAHVQRAKKRRSFLSCAALIVETETDLLLQFLAIMMTLYAITMQRPAILTQFPVIGTCGLRIAFASVVTQLAPFLPHFMFVMCDIAIVATHFGALAWCGKRWRGLRCGQAGQCEQGEDSECFCNRHIVLPMVCVGSKLCLLLP
jgi:hypothetical protein